MPADGATLGRKLCTIFGHQLLAKVCCVRESQLGNSVDPYAMAISFMLTVTLLWQYIGFFTGLKYSVVTLCGTIFNKIYLFIVLKYGGF